MKLVRVLVQQQLRVPLDSLKATLCGRDHLPGVLTSDLLKAVDRHPDVRSEALSSNADEARAHRALAFLVDGGKRLAAIQMQRSRGEADSRFVSGRPWARLTTR